MEYGFYFVACKPGASECSDELIDCPSAANLNERWWEGFADTLAESAVSTDTSFSATIAGAPTVPPHRRATHTAPPCLHPVTTVGPSVPSLSPPPSLLPPTVATTSNATGRTH